MTQKTKRFCLRMTEEDLDRLDMLQKHWYRSSRSDTVRYLLVRACQAFGNDPVSPHIDPLS
jgi:hypothetical protein